MARGISKRMNGLKNITYGGNSLWRSTIVHNIGNNFYSQLNISPTTTDKVLTLPIFYLEEGTNQYQAT